MDVDRYLVWDRRAQSELQVTVMGSAHTTKKEFFTCITTFASKFGIGEGKLVSLAFDQLLVTHGKALFVWRL